MGKPHNKSPLDKYKEKQFQEIMKRQMEKEKGKVGPDRKKKFDDVYASTINTGTMNQKYPSYFDEKKAAKPYLERSFNPGKDPNLNIIDLDNIA